MSVNPNYDQGSNTVGNLTGVTEADSSTVLFGYDALYRLTAEQRTGTAAESHSYGYDPAGNMTSKDGSTTNLSYDAANKLSATSVFSYDKDGDMTSSSPSSSSYGWDDRGNMISRSVSGQVSYAYGYNAQGQRVHSVITPSAQPTVNTFFIYDGDKLLGEVSSTGTVNAVYTWGADGLASERLLPATTAKSLFYAFGPQGETRQLTGSTGQVVDSYTYTAWGQALSSSGSDTNPFQYGGQHGYYTEYGGAVLCGHRWYDTHDTLRWLSRDPIGYEGGSNLYAYCKDNPAGVMDPDGMQAEPVEPFRPGRSPVFSDEFEDDIEILKLAEEIRGEEAARHGTGLGEALALRAEMDELFELKKQELRDRKPEYVVNDPHLYSDVKDPLPDDAEEAYERSILDPDGRARWSKASKDKYYRYQGDHTGWHFNGEFNSKEAKSGKRCMANVTWKRLNSK